jgi:hypothetical protein
MTIKRAKSKSRNSDARGRKTNYINQAQAVAPQLRPPQVVGFPLNDPSYLTFEKFLHLPQTKALFAMTGDAANLLAALTNEREFVLARANAVSGKAQKAQWRKLLAQYVRRAYLGDERGLLYWRRIAKLIWVAYENMLRLKTWAARAREGEMARIARWQARAAKERARQKDRRAGAKAA